VKTRSRCCRALDLSCCGFRDCTLKSINKNGVVFDRGTKTFSCEGYNCAPFDSAISGTYFCELWSKISLVRHRRYICLNLSEVNLGRTLVACEATLDCLNADELDLVDLASSILASEESVVLEAWVFSRVSPVEVVPALVNVLVKHE